MIKEEFLTAMNDLIKQCKKIMDDRANTYGFIYRHRDPLVFAALIYVKAERLYNILKNRLIDKEQNWFIVNSLINDQLVDIINYVTFLKEALIYESMSNSSEVGTTD